MRVIDPANRARLQTILRRESHSLFQYLREVPPWTGLRERNAVARMRELANAELTVCEELSRWLQMHNARGPLGAFPDFTPYNDAAMHFLLPAIIREQKQHISALEHDRAAVSDHEAGEILDRLIELKRRHLPELESLHTSPHVFTTVSV